MAVRPGQRVCIVGASGRLGKYLVAHALQRGYEVVGVCRPQSAGKLAEYADDITIVPGMTDDRSVIARAVAGCDGVLVVLAPWGVHHYATGTAQAVLDLAPAQGRLVFSAGWFISRDGQDVLPWKVRVKARLLGWVARRARIVDLDDQVEACNRIFASRTRRTVVRGSDLEEARARACPCGVAMSATRSSRATSRVAWTSPYP